MKRRSVRTRSRAEWKAKLRGMSEQQRKDFNDTRRRTAQSGYAKRQRERDNGAPMSDRTHEGVRKRFVTPFVQPSSEFARWLRDMQRRTA